MGRRQQEEGGGAERGENKGQRRRRKEMRGEKRRRRKGYATHVSSQRSLPASQLPVLAARILTDRPYGFIMRHTNKTHTPCTPASTNSYTHLRHACALRQTQVQGEEEEVCDKLNEGSEEEDVMAR